MVAHNGAGRPGPTPLVPAGPPPEEEPRGFLIPYWWLASAADAAMVTGLIETGTSPVAAGLIGTGLLVVPRFVFKASQDRRE